MINVNTGLKGFVFPDTILEIDKSRVRASIVFKCQDAPVPWFLGIEALAQTAAMHVRYLCGFKRHAFLLKIGEFHEAEQPVSGVEYEIQGVLGAGTDSAFSHGLTMGTKTGRSIITATLVIAVKPYDDLFRRTSLEAHYRARFKRMIMA